MDMRLIFDASLLLLLGLLAGKLANKIKLPAVTGYLIAGIIIGPSFLSLLGKPMLDATDLISNVALSLIAFNIGSGLTAKNLRKLGKGVLVIAILEALGATVAVTFWLEAKRNQAKITSDHELEQLLDDYVYPGESVELSFGIKHGQVVQMLPGRLDFVFHMGANRAQNRQYPYPRVSLVRLKVPVYIKEDAAESGVSGEIEASWQEQYRTIPPYDKKQSEFMSAFEIRQSGDGKNTRTNIEEWGNYYPWGQPPELEQFSLDSGDIVGVIPLQVPPWAQGVTLKVITEDGLMAVYVPVDVSTDIGLVEISENAWRTAEGEPVVMSWYHPDIRTIFYIDPRSSIREDFENMKDLGVNVTAMLWYDFWMRAIGHDSNRTHVSFNREAEWYVTRLAEELGIDILLDVTYSGRSFYLYDSIEWFYENFSHIMYQTQDGDLPVLGGAGLSGVWHRGRYEEDVTPRLVSAFMRWAEEKYGNIQQANRVWGTNYSSFNEFSGIKLRSNSPPYDDHGLLANDWDTFRSFDSAGRFEEYVVNLKSIIPNALPGPRGENILVGMADSYALGNVYGIGDYDERIHGFFTKNLGERASMKILASNLYMPMSVKDYERAVRAAVDGGITPLYFILPNSWAFIQDSAGIDNFYSYGVKGRIVQTLLPIVPYMKVALEQGGVPCFYAWNDQGVGVKVTSVQRRELAFFRQLLRK
jgi:hypothetical protein